MANPSFRDELIKEIRAALQSFKNAARIDHSGLKGLVREILTEKLLQPILPPGVEIGNGKITDSLGNLSAQSDLIIYSRATLPPLIYGRSTGLYPVEACLYAIEVKSALNSQELKNSIENFKRLRTLQYLPSFYPFNFVRPIGPACSFVIPALFAFSTDLVKGGKSEIDRYFDIDSSAHEAPIIPVICVAERGYWWFQSDDSGKKWHYYPPSDEHDEIIDFFGGVANSVPIEILKKGQPYYGNYVITPRKLS